MGQGKGVLLWRREGWQLGRREDWRYADMRREWGRHWPWYSFLVVYLVQQIMLVGLSAPFLVIHTTTAPWHPFWDSVLSIICVAGASLSTSNLLRASEDDPGARSFPLAPTHASRRAFLSWVAGDKIVMHLNIMGVCVVTLEAHGGLTQ